jgi:hypothetical protein
VKNLKMILLVRKTDKMEKKVKIYKNGIAIEKKRQK